jgi:hypothetical protein
MPEKKWSRWTMNQHIDEAQRIVEGAVQTPPGTYVELLALAQVHATIAQAKAVDMLDTTVTRLADLKEGP